MIKSDFFFLFFFSFFYIFPTLNVFVETNETDVPFNKILKFADPTLGDFERGVL